jgi:hypothetical protein
MITLLYRDYLLLATAGKTDHTYTVKAIISMSEVRMEEADNGRGEFLPCSSIMYDTSKTALG